MAKGPSKFIWAGLQFVRGPHPRGIPKNCWFHDPLKLAVIETAPGRFSSYAQLADVYPEDASGACHATVSSVTGSYLNALNYATDPYGALDQLLLVLAAEESGPWTQEIARTRAAELIDEIETARSER